MPSRCASATNVRLTALSMSSTHMKMTMALRRRSTPATPSVNNTAEMNSAGPSSMLELSFREHDGADDRGEQQQARDLERNQIRLEQGVGDRGHHSLVCLQLRDRSCRQLDRVWGPSVLEHPQLKQ